MKNLDTTIKNTDWFYKFNTHYKLPYITIYNTCEKNMNLDSEYVTIFIDNLFSNLYGSIISKILSKLKSEN